MFFSVRDEGEALWGRKAEGCWRYRVGWCPWEVK